MKSLPPTRSSGHADALFVALLTFTILSTPADVHALISVNPGDSPVDNRGWPEGSEHVANLPGRLGYWEGPPFGGGQYVFEFGPSDTEAVQAALDTFARIKAPRLDLVLLPGSTRSTFLEEPDDPETKAALGMTFKVWRAENWNRLFNNPATTFAADQPGFRAPVPPPILSLHLGATDTLDPDKLTIPENVTVIDRRLENADLPATERGPDRAAIGGAVTDLSTNQPIPGARVAFSAGRSAGDSFDSAAAAADGRFVASTNRTEGGAYLVASADGYAPLLSREFFELRPGIWYANNEVALAPAATFRGRIRTAAGDPVPGLAVAPADILAADGSGYPQPEAPPATTAEDGTFTIAALPAAGSIGIRLRAPGWHLQTPLARLPITNDDPVEITVIPTGTVDVRVTPPTAAANQAWHVAIEPEDGAGIGKWSGSARCQPDGACRFENVPVGAYHVRISTPEASDPVRVLVEPRATASVTLRP